MTLSAVLDPRTTLARPALAEQALEGCVRARAYRATRPMHGVVAVADIQNGPASDAERIDQLLFGEGFDVLDQAGDHVWGRARRDGVVGWIAASALAVGTLRTTRRVASARAALPLNALVVETPVGVSESDLVPIETFETDPVAVAETLLGVPHRLGARSSLATDCSGLVQQALYACGLAGPRHSDQQAELGHAVAREEIRRGDLAIWLAGPGETRWSGHSALVLDTGRLIHATGHHGAVTIELLADAEARYVGDGFVGPVFRRVWP